MCEVLTFLIASVGEILKSALGIGLGTALAWYCVVGPVLRQNERRKKEEEIIENTIEFVYNIQSRITEIAENRPPTELSLSELSETVHEFTNHINSRIRSTIPGLAEAMHACVNRLINGTRPPTELEENNTGDSDRSISLYVDRLTTEVPEICKLMITTLSEHKREAFQSRLAKSC